MLSTPPNPPAVSPHQTTYTTSQTQKEADKPVYIFGYGSLMFTPARTATTADPENTKYIPVKLNGYERDWRLVNKNTKMRVLGINPETITYTTGVIFNTTKQKLSSFDKREGENAYQRTLVFKEHFKFYTKEDTVPDNAEIYAYIPIKTDIREAKGYYLTENPHDENYKIFLSYRDVVIAGAFEIDEKYKLNGRFAQDTFDTLNSESYQVEDDRKNPKYSRHPMNLQETLKEKQENLNTKKDELENKKSKLQQPNDENIQSELSGISKQLAHIKYFLSQIPSFQKSWPKSLEKIKKIEDKKK